MRGLSCCYAVRLPVRLRKLGHGYSRILLSQGVILRGGELPPRFQDDSRVSSNQAPHMPLTKIENELRTQARSLIAEGRLPGAPAVRTYGGYGAGGICSLCSQPIKPEEVEFEIEHTTLQGGPFRFHFLCHAAWQFECARYNHLQGNSG